MELNEALYTTRAMRRVKPDPVPEDIVAAMMDAAVRAPSGGNTQNWRWLTVTERDTMHRLGDLYRAAWDQLTSTFYAGRLEQAEARGDQQTIRVMESSQWLADNFDQVPLVVLPFHRNDPTGASIYPAVWSLMLEARSHGVGTALTTVLGMFQSPALFELLGVPTDKGWSNAAAVTCGYPLGRWGVAARAPAHQVVYRETWGAAPNWVIDQPLWPPVLA
jgi:nitroreductase